MTGSKRLTTPEEMNLVRRLYPTGNHFVSLPVVEARDGSVDRVGVLHFGSASLVEFGGPQAELGSETLPPLEPFLRPFAIVGGRKVYPEGGLVWWRLEDWIPTFTWTDPSSGLTLEGTVFAPLWRDREGVGSHKGFCYVLRAGQPRAGAGGAGAGGAGTGGAWAAPPGDIRLGLDLVWGELVQTVYTSRRLPAEFSVRGDRWTGGPVLEPRSGAGAGPAALAVAFSAPPGEAAWSARTERTERSERTEHTERAERVGRAEGGGPGATVRLEIAARPEPEPGGEPAVATAFYFGTNREGDGARTAAVDLSRRGWRALLNETRSVLAGLRRRLSAASLAAAAAAVSEGLSVSQTVLEARLNLNLFFNYFFAVGRTIDTEELVLVTSRSPLYYVSAAFWARDALLWSLPGLILVDPVLAEEALGLAFTRYFRHAGIHSLYLDGRLLYPGFELDELAAYPIALHHYVAATGDAGILARRELVPKLERLVGLMEDHACPQPGVHLFDTFLLPSDDPATYPYVTYDNVMAWRALRSTAELVRLAAGDVESGGGRTGGAERGQAAGRGDRVERLTAWAAELEARAAAVRESVYRHLVVEGPRGKMFAWSADLAGGSEITDEPPGSLELLPYYGFCPRNDEIWRNTVGWIHSRDNPYRYTDVPFPGLGCPHAEHPFVMSLFNALLGGLPERVAEAVKVLAQAPLDNGLACESYDRWTGEVKTGAAFATCAGFVGYALDRVLGARVRAGVGEGGAGGWPPGRGRGCGCGRDEGSSPKGPGNQDKGTGPISWNRVSRPRGITIPGQGGPP